MQAEFCAGCPTAIRSECRGSFARIGVMKIHWECWTQCNLACPFCYRSRGQPLDTAEAETLLAAFATAGATSVVFAGGDPSIRPDIVRLIGRTRELDLGVEVHTNAHTVRAAFAKALLQVDLVGLSLDGPDPETHDGFRQKSGNYGRVLSTLRMLDRAGVPVIVRTVVARPNFSRVADIGHILLEFQNLERWSLMEFSPVGDGFRNRHGYTLDRQAFDDVATKAMEQFAGELAIDVYRLEAKVGTYALVSPDGRLFSVTRSSFSGDSQFSGSMLEDHLQDLVERLPFSSENHRRRYGSLAAQPERR